MNNNYKYLIWSGTAVLVILSVFLLASTDKVVNTAATTNTVSFSGEGPSRSMFLSPQAAFAEQNWKNEFDAICAKNDDAMSLGVDELKNLIQRCDKLKPRIEALDESSRKVYLKRLQLCRDLYLFVLESKEQEKLQPSAAAPGRK